MEETEVVGGASFTARFDSEKITRLRFVEMIMSNIF